MKTIDKVLQLRESLKLKVKGPGRAFSSRLLGPSKILRLVEANADSELTKCEARRNYIVNLVTAFEIYWRDFIKQTVDANPKRLKSFERFKKETFTLDDVSKIIGRELTLGELISTSYTFHSLDVLNDAVSRLLNIDALGKFSKSHYKITMEEIIKKSEKGKKKPFVHKTRMSGIDILRRKPIIEKCFLVRHETVHNTGLRFGLTKKDVEEMTGTISTFNIFFSFFIESYIDKK